MHNILRKDLIHRDRGQRNLKLERVYRELYDQDHFLACYAKLYGNDGAMTPGVTAETVNGMSEEKLRRIIQALRDGSFAWSPTKRVYIPKRNGKQRPLGLPMCPSYCTSFQDALGMSIVSGSDQPSLPFYT